jgi:PPOX class probable F420-dependent enzyme
VANVRRDIQLTPAEIDVLLHERRTMSVATVNHDGTIHMTAMWYGFVNGAPALWTYGASQKVRNLERDPRVTALVEGGEAYEEIRGVELVGRGEIIRDRDVVLEVGLEVYGRYRGELTDDVRPLVERMGAKRVVVRIDAERTVSWDHRKLAAG